MRNPGQISWLQNYQNFTEMTSNMIYIVAFGVGLKCPHKIHLNTQCPPPPIKAAGKCEQEHAPTEVFTLHHPIVWCIQMFIKHHRAMLYVLLTSRGPFLTTLTKFSPLLTIYLPPAYCWPIGKKSLRESRTFPVPHLYIPSIVNVVWERPLILSTMKQKRGAIHVLYDCCVLEYTLEWAQYRYSY